MKIVKPSLFVAPLTRTDGVAQEMCLKNHIDNMKFLKEELHRVPDAEVLAWTAKMTEAYTNIVLTAEEMLIILAHYPMSRAILVSCGPLSDGGREILKFVIAHYFGSTQWPTYHDDVPGELFLKQLRIYATAMGYKVKP